MKYLLLIYGDESALSQTELEQCYDDSTRVAHELKEAGRLLGVAPLQKTDVAKTVRVSGGRRIVTDGPFAETREQLGGYFLVDVPTLDDALEIASRLPGAQKGSVEVRPLVELPGL